MFVLDAQHPLDGPFSPAGEAGWAAANWAPGAADAMDTGYLVHRYALAVFVESD